MSLKLFAKKTSKGFDEPKTSSEDDENIIRDMIREEELEKKTVVISPNITLLRKKEARDLGVRITKIILGICILLFIVSLFSPWFQLGGKTTELGFVQIKKSMADKRYLEQNPEDLLNYNGPYVVASPMQLVVYSAQHYKEHQTVYGRDGEVTSIFSWIHMILILTFLVIMFLSFVSMALLFITPGLKWMRVVKISAIISFILCCMNFFVLKMPYMNMFVIHAQSVLKKMNLLNAVSITGKGIAMNNIFYPYELFLTNTFFVGLGLMGVWTITSAVLVEIKRKRDEDLRDIELKAKIKL